MGMLIPERALPELLAELQRPEDLAAADVAGGWPGSGGGNAGGGASAARAPALGAQKGSLMDIMAGMR